MKDPIGNDFSAIANGFRVKSNKMKVFYQFYYYLCITIRQ